MADTKKSISLEQKRAEDEIFCMVEDWLGVKVSRLLASCYFHSMQVALEYGIRSIAFPSISTRVYSFPVELAANIAVKTVSRFLENNENSFDIVEWFLGDFATESVYEKEVDKLYS